MQSFFSLKSKNENLYTFHIDSKSISLTHPLVYKYLKSENVNQETLNDKELYYKKKADYLKKYFYLKSKKKCFNGSITKEQIIREICNVRQVVFEVTDSCNLKCKYCGYGEFYTNYDLRSKKMMNTELAKTLINYLVDTWSSSGYNVYNRTIYIGFYGGEPLLNMFFIKTVVDYVNSISIKNLNFKFSMTTNAVLLHRNMEFLQANDFQLLISLDGNKYNNSYRTYPNGEFSFDTVINNIDKLQQNYPLYFENKVNFNVVLHNRNSIKESYDFIFNRFKKIPRFGELNQSGLNPIKQKEFFKMNYQKSNDYYKINEINNMNKNLLIFSPLYSFATKFFRNQNQYHIESYSDFFYKRKINKYLPSGTCIPFSRKLFVTVNGKILPCERIGFQFLYGNVSSNNVFLSIDNIVEKYNLYLSKIGKYCAKCYKFNFCSQCLYFIKELDEDSEIVCPDFSNKSKMVNYLSLNVNFIENFPEMYSRIIKGIIWD